MYRRPFIFTFIFISSHLFSQKDSCNCVAITPGIGFAFPDNVFTEYKKVLEQKPFNGICHAYYMKVAYVLPDYERTFMYGKFDKGELTYFIETISQAIRWFFINV